MDSRFQSMTGAEWFGYGDFDGDGLIEGIVIDRETGAMRRLVPAGPGAPTWETATFSGLGQLDTFSVGPIVDPARDQIVLGGMAANRTHVVAPTDASLPLAQLFTTGVGHRSVVAVDLNLSGNDPSRMDLIINTGWANEPGTQSLFQSTAAGFQQNGSEGPAPERWRAHQRVKVVNNGQDYVLFLQGTADPAIETAVLADPQTPRGAPVDSVSGIHAFSEYIHGPFLDGSTSQFVFYVPGSAEIQISLTDPTPFLLSPVTHTLPFAIGSLHLTHDTNGYGFLAIADNGSEAALFRLNASAVPIAEDTFLPDEGRRLTGALAIGEGQLTVLQNKDSGFRSEEAVHFANDGTGWIEQGRAVMPAVGEWAGTANILFFQGEPFVNESAALTATVRIPDWTRDLSIAGDKSATVVAETLGASGLGSPANQSAGTAPSTTTHGWTNQVTPQVSMTTDRVELGLTAPNLEIQPAGGILTSWSTITMEPSNPSATVHYRLGEGGTWTSGLSSQTVEPVGATLSDFSIFAFTELNGVRSPVRQVDYQFAPSDQPLDSDDDGVPDYVEIANGLSPIAGADTDGDGYSDLRELLDGTDPADNNSRPASVQSLAQQSVFNIAVRPLSLDTVSDLVPDRPCFPASPNRDDPAATRVGAYALDGELLHSAMTDSYPQDSFAGFSAWLPGIPAEPLGGFIVVGTDASFPIRFDSSVLDATGQRDDDRGVELVGCIPIPWLELEAVPYTPPAGTDPATAAAAWLGAAQAHYATLGVEQHEQVLTFLDTLKLLLTENLFARLLLQRDPLFDVGAFSLTPFRDSPGSPATDPAALMALEQPEGIHPAYRLQSIFETVATAVDSAPTHAMQQLRDLSRELYLIAGTIGPTEPGLYPPVIDTLRAFLRGESLPGHPGSSYAAAISLSPAELAAAQGAVTALLSQLIPRPTEAFLAEITSASFADGTPELRKKLNGQPLRLLQPNGEPFPFPPGLPLLPGTEVTAIAFNDRTDGPFIPDTAVETLSVTITSLPAPDAIDMDQNGLDDNWERLLIGATGSNPFEDADGDGVSTLEELLEGTHPLLTSSAPANPQLPLRPPSVTIAKRTDGDLEFQIQFPSAFTRQLGFRLQTSETLGEDFIESTLVATPDTDGQFSLQIQPSAGVDVEFFRFRLFLK